MDKKRILVVDDEVELAEIVKSRLEAAGYEVLLAHDGQAGLEVARREQPDVIVLDVMLPKLDGYKVSRILKFDKRYKHIPILMFTARAQKSDKKTGEDVGADAYMTKPFEPKALLAKIKELLK